MKSSGSTGYGQKFSDAIARDQVGGETRDVLAAVDATLAKYPWIDGSDLGWKEEITEAS